MKKQKRYFVVLQNKIFTHTFTTNSFELAKKIADLKIFRNANIQDARGDDGNLPLSKIIYIKRHES